MHDVDGGRTALARGRLGGGEGSASESAQRGTGGDHEEHGGGEDEQPAAPVDRRPRTAAASRRRNQREVPATGCLRSSVGTGIGNGGHRTALLRSNLCS